ncbi:MAG: RDD family protein [Terriglobales bacterium]
MTTSTSGRETTTGRVYTPHATARMESLAGLPLAPFKARAAAFFIDMVLVLIVWLPFTFLFLRALHYREINPRIDLKWDFHEPSNIVFALLYFGLALYFGNGRTPGKRLLRIRVVSLVRDRITFWQAMERALGYGASFLEGGLGFFQYFTNSNRCCVHDRIAETIVVKDPR